MIRPLNLRARQVRSLRNWGIELLIVVVGVLLALWASQWVSDREARKNAEIAAAAMDRDLMFMGHGLMRRFTTQPCIIAALKRLQIAAATPDGGTFVAPPVAKIDDDNDGLLGTYYPVGTWSYPMQAFDRAVATGAFNHMDPERARHYADAYSWVEALARTNKLEGDLEARLSTIAMYDRMDAPSRLALRRDIADADNQNRFVLRAGRFLFDSMRRLGIEPDDEARADWKFYNERAREVRGDCVIDLPLDFSGETTGRGWSSEVEE